MDLVIGSGLIGRALHYRLRGVITSRREIDLTRDGWELPKCKTAYICAAETSSEKCEKYPEETRLVNVANTIKLAEKLSGHVVFLSSERVFDGSKPFRKVTDKVCPVTEYGRQKAKAEKALLDIGCSVIRLSKVIGWDMPLFESWVEDLKKGEIHPYSNYSMSPLPVNLVSEYIEKIGEIGEGGLFQLSAREDLSYDRIAYHICNYIGMDMDLVQPVLAEVGHPNTTLESDVKFLDIPDAWDTIYKWCKDRIRRREWQRR